MDYLSAAQRRIVEYPFDRAHIVVLAAPGSGKTRTITERAAHLVASRQISSEQILVLAFSTKAASTLAARLECAPDVHMQDACVDTFHAFAARLLREHGRAIGCGPPFVVYDEPRQEHVLRRAAAAVRWPLPDRRAVNELRERISRRKCAGLDASQQPFRGPPDPAALLRVDATYRALLAGAGAMDRWTTTI